MDRINRISIFGLGKLGSPIAAALAARGFTVIGVDTDPHKVEAINNGRPPVFEPGLADMLARANGRLTASTDPTEAVRATDATLIMVPTPSDPDGSFSLRYVLPACEQIGRALRQRDGRHLVSVCSTVMPGATGGAVRDALEAASGRAVGADLGLCYSPEFIALGSVIRDFLNPDFVLIGESDERAGEALESMYRRACENGPRIARMNFINAELTKIAVNSYITTKITYANMVAGVCENLPGADVDTVTGALGLDSRIGPKYLRGGAGYGGPCFPRDNRALARAAEIAGAPAELPRTVDQSNRREAKRLAQLVLESAKRLASTADRLRIGILGLSYKPETDVVEESPGVLLARHLVDEGMNVVAYDPAALSAARNVLGEAVGYATTLRECIDAADILVITTPWSEFRSLNAGMFPTASKRILIDCWRCVEAQSLGSAVEYVPVGVGPSPPLRMIAEESVPQVEARRPALARAAG